MAPRTRGSSQSGDEDRVPSPYIKPIPQARRIPSRSSGQPSVSPTRAAKGRFGTLQKTTSLISAARMREGSAAGTRESFVNPTNEAMSERTVRATSTRVQNELMTSPHSAGRVLRPIASARRQTASGLKVAIIDSPARHIASASPVPLVGNLKDNSHRKAARRSAGHPSLQPKETFKMRLSVLPNHNGKTASGARTDPQRLTLDRRVEILRDYAEQGIRSVFDRAMNEDEEESSLSETTASRLDWDSLESAKRAIFVVRNVYPFIYLEMLKLPQDLDPNELIPDLEPAVDLTNLACFLRIICDPGETARALFGGMSGQEDANTRALLKHAFKSFLGICLPKSQWDSSPAMLSMIDMATQIYLYGAEESDVAGLTLDDLFSPSAVSRLDHWQEATKKFGTEAVEPLKARASNEWKDLAEERAKILSKLDREDAVQQYPYDSFRREIIAAISAMQPAATPSNAVGNAIYAEANMEGGEDDTDEEESVDDELANRSRSAEEPDDRHHDQIDAGKSGSSRMRGTSNRSSRGLVDGRGQLLSEDDLQQSDQEEEDRGVFDYGAAGEVLAGTDQEVDGAGQDRDASDDTNDEDMDDEQVDVAGRPFGGTHLERHRDVIRRVTSETGHKGAEALDPEGFFSVVQEMADREKSEHESQIEPEDEDPDQGSSWAINRSEASARHPAQILGPHVASNAVGPRHDFSKPQKNSVQIPWEDEDVGVLGTTSAPATIQRQPPRKANAAASQQQTAVSVVRTTAQPERDEEQLGLDETGPATPRANRTRALLGAIRTPIQSLQRFAAGLRNDSPSQGDLERSSVPPAEHSGPEPEGELFEPEREDLRIDYAGDDLDMTHQQDQKSDLEEQSEGSHVGDVQDDAGDEAREERRADASSAVDEIADGAAFADAPMARLPTASATPSTPAASNRPQSQTPLGARRLPVNLARRPDIPAASAARVEKRLIVSGDEEIDELASSDEASRKRQRLSRKSTMGRPGPSFVSRALDPFMLNEHGLPLHDADGNSLQEDADIPKWVEEHALPSVKAEGADYKSKYRYSATYKARWTPAQCLALYRKIQVMPIVRRSAYHNIAYHFLGEPSRTKSHQPEIPGFNPHQFRDKIKEEVKKRTRNGLPVVGNARFYLPTSDPRKVACNDERLLARRDIDLADEQAKTEALGDESETNAEVTNSNASASEDDDSDEDDDGIESEDGAPLKRTREAARANGKGQRVVREKRTQRERSRSVSASVEAAPVAPPSPTISESEQAAAPKMTGRKRKVPTEIPLAVQAGERRRTRSMQSEAA